MLALVSVIIPAHNEEEYILETITSILNQTYKKIEIIVVDDGSKDNTRKIVQGLQEKYKNIRLVPFDNGHSAAFARNNGAKVAKGEIIIFQDGDCIADKKMVESVVVNINKGFDGVASRTLNAEPKTLIGRAIQAQRSLRWETKEEKRKEINSFSGILVANMKKKCFDSLGGFNDKIFYFEDADLTKRFFEKGYTAVYAPDSKQFHHDPDTLSETIGQSKSFGKGIAWLLKQGKGHKKLIVPFYSIVVLVGLILAVFNLFFLILLIPLLLLFLIVLVRSKDLASSLVFIILFEIRNLFKVYSVVLNLIK